MAAMTTPANSIDVRAHPAAAAWSRGPALGRPSRIATLQDTPARSVYLLQGVAVAGGEAIAKRSPAGSLAVEQLVYDEVLPQLALPALRCYGLVPDSNGTDDWLFVEVAGGAVYSPLDRQHRALAGKFLGRLHVCCPTEDLATRLPQREPIPYRRYIDVARAGLTRYLSDGAPPRDETAPLAALLAQLDIVARHDATIDARIATLPRAIVHGDFVARNARVSARRDGLALLPFDWQDAGWGTPEADLAEAPLPSLNFAGNPDLRSYWLEVCAYWPELDPRGLHEVATIATLFRCLVAISWDAPGLGLWGPRVVERMKYYHDALRLVLHASGWSA